MFKTTVNNFSLGVDSESGVGEVMRSGYKYATLNHKSEYSVLLVNNHSSRCDVDLEIDGKKVGTWRLGPNQQVKLERPSGIARRFTFFKEETTEARDLGIVKGKKDNGLIKATFRPERKYDCTTMHPDRMSGIISMCWNLILSDHTDWVVREVVLCRTKKQKRARVLPIQWYSMLRQAGLLPAQPGSDQPPTRDSVMSPRLPM